MTILFFNLMAFVSGKFGALLLAKSITTSALLIFIFSDKNTSQSHTYKIIITLLFLSAADSIVGRAEVDLQGKGMGYFAFLIWALASILVRGKAPVYFGIVAAIVGIATGARGVFIVIAFAYALTTINSRAVKVAGILGFFFLYTLLIPGLVIGGNAFFDVGKSEIDRSMMNAYVSAGLIDGYLAPQPALIGSSNVLEYSDAENIFVHNYFLVLIAYCGPLILLLPGRLVNARRATSKNAETAAWAILALLTISPESNIARFLLFCLPGLLSMPRREHKVPSPAIGAVREYA